MQPTNSFYFAPQLFIRKGVTNIDFYSRALGAEERMRWSNEDGSIHVAELSIHGAIFHLHEEVLHKNEFCPDNQPGNSTIIGLFVPDVDAIMATAIAAGAIVLSPALSYDYGYRQGEFKDPFGHIWMIESKI